MNLTRTLTEYLTSSSYGSRLYFDATQHEFLTLAGQGRLPLDRLTLWLAQDRIYASHAYPHFIGALIARIPFRASDEIDGAAEKKNQELLRVLTSCLTNIVREVDFFKQTAKTFDMDMGAWLELKGTRDYTAEMARVSQSLSMEEGLVFLWAMEKLYLDAWTYVYQVLQTGDFISVSTLAVQTFATNWSSPEFGSFVESLANLINHIKPGTVEWYRAEVVWLRVLELEATFWPKAGQENLMRKRL